MPTYELIVTATGLPVEGMARRNFDSQPDPLPNKGWEWIEVQPTPYVPEKRPMAPLAFYDFARSIVGASAWATIRDDVANLRDANERLTLARMVDLNDLGTPDNPTTFLGAVVALGYVTEATAQRIIDEWPLT